MKFVPTLILFVLIATPVAAEELNQVAVSFQQPENFTDFRSANGGRQDGQPALMAELDRFLREQGDLWLDDQQRLEITFKNIDMAGRIVPLPMRRTVAGGALGVYGSAPEQRVIQNLWPPRLTFDFVLYDEYGQTIRQGSMDINEQSFIKTTPRAMYNRRDSLWYEKAVLDSWFRNLES